MGCSSSIKIKKIRPLKYMIAIDGSSNSALGFEFIFNEVYKRSDYVYLIHVITAKRLTDIPFSQQTDELLDTYGKIMAKKISSDHGKLIKKENNHSDNKEESLRLVLEESLLRKCDLLVVGFSGHSGQKTKKRISNSLKCCLFNSNIPILITKKFVPREKKRLKRYNWFVCLNDKTDKEFNFKALDFCTNLFDWESDIIIGYHFNSNINKKKEVENQFMEFCQKKRILKKKFIFELSDDLELRSHDIHSYVNKNISLTGRMISNTINFGVDEIDYLLINHNITKYPDIDKCPTVQVIKFANCNIICSKEF